MRGKRPSPWASSNSSNNLGRRLYRTVTPSRQAACARAQASQVLPTPQGPVIIRLRLSRIHFAGQQLLEKGFVQPSARPVVHIFRSCSYMAQFGGAHAALKAPGGTAGCLAVDQQAQPFSVAEADRSVLCFQFAEGFRHSVRF